jgi:hypothetical protein
VRVLKSALGTDDKFGPNFHNSLFTSTHTCSHTPKLAGWMCYILIKCNDDQMHRGHAVA